MLACKERGLKYYIIASGQNDITRSVILRQSGCGQTDLQLSNEKNIRKSACGLLVWWMITYTHAIGAFRSAFEGVDFTRSLMIVHGDTVSTYMGARIGRKLGMTVCHIEAGLRSHNILNPFPEEIDRLLTSRIARLHFASGDEAERNLRRAKGKVINTCQNTLLDSLRISRTFSIESKSVERIVGLGEAYFVFVMHRQENLSNKKFVRQVIENIEKAAGKTHCILILHKITESTLAKFGLLENLKGNPAVTLLHRVQYFDFMKLLECAYFVITDGGSNQEELYYMSKPTLILRKNTERNEGIGVNARLYERVEDIMEFASGQYSGDKYNIDDHCCPSEKIVEEILKS